VVWHGGVRYGKALKSLFALACEAGAIVMDWIVL
jgi:hypothetical protein